MPTLTYIGPHDEVEVPAAGGVVLKRGDTFEVADPDLAASLLEQVDNFKSTAKGKGA